MILGRWVRSSGWGGGWLGLDEIRLDLRHRIGIFSRLLFWAFGSDKIRPTASFSVVFCLERMEFFFLPDRFWVATVGMLAIKY